MANIDDTEDVIRIRISKNRNCNVQKTKGTRTNNDLENTTQKTKYIACYQGIQF